MQRMWGALRIHADFPTRNRKRRPDRIPVNVIFKDGTEGTISVAADEFPPTLTLPRFPPAGILRGIPDTGAPVEGAKWWSFWEHNSLVKFANRYGIKSVTAEVSPDKFARLIAKIAHATAVWRLGIDGFHPLATDFILYGKGGMNHLVGCWREGEVPEEETEKFWTVNGPITRPDSPLILFQVRLFGGQGAPTYHVVVGAKMDSSPECSSASSSASS